MFTYIFIANILNTGLIVEKTFAPFGILHTHSSATCSRDCLRTITDTILSKYLYYLNTIMKITIHDRDSIFFLRSKSLTKRFSFYFIIIFESDCTHFDKIVYLSTNDILLTSHFFRMIQNI